MSPMGLCFQSSLCPALTRGLLVHLGLLFYALYSICWNLSRNCLINFLWEVMGFSFSRRAFWKCQRPEVSPSSLTQWVWPLHSYTLLTARPPRPSSKQEPLLCAGWAVADSSATNPHPRLPEGRSHSQPHGVWQTLWSCGEFVDHPKDNVPSPPPLEGWRTHCAFLLPLVPSGASAGTDMQMAHGCVHFSSAHFHMLTVVLFWCCMYWGIF